MPPVVLTFPVSINMISGNIELFGQNVTSDNKVILLNTVIQAADISGMIWYVQAPGNPNSVLLRASTVFTNFDNTKFLADLSGSLDSPVTLQGGGAYSWWPNAQDSRKADYTSPLFNYDSIYQFLLGWISYNVFSHPLAQAGISNDVQILASLRASNIVGGLWTAIEALTNEQLLVVFQEILRQDSGRFNNDDLNETEQPISHPIASPQFLKFLPGDKIRFEIHLTGYDVLQGNNPSDPLTNGMTGTVTNVGDVLKTGGNDYFTLEVDLSGVMVDPPYVPGEILKVLTIDISGDNFNLETTGGVVEEYIDWGDGTTSQGGTYTHTYSSVGAYKIKLFTDPGVITSIVVNPLTVTIFISNMVFHRNTFPNLTNYSVFGPGTINTFSLPTKCLVLYISDISGGVASNNEDNSSSNLSVIYIKNSNNITSIPTLPVSITILEMNNYTITDFSNAPLTLTSFTSEENGYTSFPVFPQNFLHINVYKGHIANLSNMNNPNYTYVNLTYNDITQAIAEEMASALPSSTNNGIIYIAQQRSEVLNITTGPFQAAIANGWTFM